jgi:putative ABC transport system permease protein
MIQNFFKIAVRNISRHKGFTFINVAGLAIGLAASLLILLWVQDEFSYENFNHNGAKIYRVEEDQFYSGARYHVTVTPVPGGPVWKEKIPEIEDQVRINLWLPRVLFQYKEKVFFESAIAAVDSSLLSVFTFPLSLGDPGTALNSPHSIILTQKLATKYFGKENPVGKILTVENKAQFTVTGVFKEIPSNSMFTFSAVIPYSYMKEIGAADRSWGNNSIFTFIQLKKGSDISAVNKKLTDIVAENDSRITTKFNLFPLLDIHLYGQFGFKETRGPVIAVSIFILIAVFILLIACINFINLSTAKASGRGKEIGIKKVAGADQMSMVIQFMLESLLLVAIAMIFALILVGLCLGVFNNLSGKSFGLVDLFHTRFIINFILVGLVAGLLSGIYPALYLSSFKPVTVLKGEPGSARGNGKLRQIMVVIQFTLSILIAVSATFMYLQLKFLQNKELGYNKDNLICIPMPDAMKQKYYPLKLELEKETLVQGVTASMWNPTSMGSNSGGASWEGKDPEKQVLIGTNGIDYDYLKTMKMELKSGRDFSKDFTSDMAKDTIGNFLINEEVVKLMGIGDPVGKNFRFMGLNGTIVGVLKNFHFKGADQAIEPMAFALAPVNYLRCILVRLTAGKVPESLKAVEKAWKGIVPEYPLDYTFIDQDYDRLFRAQIRLAGLLKYFTILAVIIACLGLYGLSSYSAQRRTNEVGIRKVMGADSITVMYTLAREFLLPVIISIVIAIPLGWVIVSNLLKQFAYRIDISLLVFAGIALGAIVIAILTVSFQAYRATGINPAEALKVE